MSIYHFFIPLINLIDRDLDYICLICLMQLLTKAIINSTPRRRMEQTYSTDHSNDLPGSETQSAEQTP